MSQTEVHTFDVTESERNLRLDRFLSARLDGVSREKVKRAILEGHARLDGRTADSPDTRLLPGQIGELTLSRPPSGVEAEDGELSLLWHDAHLAVLDKPAGLTVHPCPSCPEGTLVHRLVGRFPELARQSGLRPGIVHRLDKDTSGLLVAALTETARLALADAFAAHQIYKEYLALVRDVPPPEGAARDPIGRHPTQKIKMAVAPENRGGRSAHSAWRVLHADPAGRFALLAVRIFTGRTHQIRVHMAHLGHPLWGDALYGPRPVAGEPAIPRQMLHAWRLRFTHPVTGEEMSFVCPPPEDFRTAVSTLARRMQRVVITGLPGCGKSSLTRRLGDRGIPTWSADAVVRRLYAPGGDGRLFLRNRFGDRFMLDAGSDHSEVNRRALLAAMRAEPELRREVEGTLHSMARCDLEHFWQDCEAAGAPSAVAEVPLYLEAHWNAPAPDVASGRSPASGTEAPVASENVVLIGVACAPAERHRRLAVTRGWNAETWATLESWQWPEDRKLRACRLVVDNSGDEAALDAAVEPLLRNLEALRLEQERALAERLSAVWGTARR
ncbi:MAG: dephospho-CoA kinase [Desulfovibrionaceae bacterium]|nr:dephospho-CoA kinase [Desulfovibrionaceae bacterium]